MSAGGAALLGAGGTGHAARGRGLDIRPDDPAHRGRRRARVGARVDRERPSDGLRLRLQRRRPIAGGVFYGAAISLEPGLSSTVLVLVTCVVIGRVVLVLVQAISGAVRGFSHDLPHIVDKARHSDLGNFVNGGSDSLDTLRKHASDITKGIGKASGGIAHVGASAFGAVTLALSVIFLTLYGLIDERRVRDWTGGLLYRNDGSATCGSRTGSSRRHRATCSATWRSPSYAGPSTGSRQ